MRGGFRYSIATWVVAACLGFGGAGVGFANNLPVSEFPFVGNDDIVITVNQDGTAQQVWTRRVKLLSDGAVEANGKLSTAFRETIQSVEVIEAFTEKADGRRIDADPASMVITEIASKDPIDAHDGKQHTVYFPDLAVGDTIVLTTRLNTKRAILPGHFAQGFTAETFFSDRIRVIVPKEMHLAVSHYGDGYEHKVAYGDSEITHTVMFAGKSSLPAEPVENGAIARSDRGTHVILTTFPDYETLGSSSFAAIAPRAQITAEIRELAESITRDLEGRRAQAEAIDRWVKRNIRYVAIEIGVGGYVPHAAADVLRNRYGDCKDKATLMSALLAVKGIASELALIDSGNTYSLPERPRLGAFNHVILYVPEFNTYTDPTAASAAFGVLHQATYDKPVVRLAAGGGIVGRTPAMRPDDHTNINRTTINIASDGRVTGETTEVSTGIFAAHARDVSAKIRPNSTERMAQEQLRANGFTGKGRYQIGRPAELAEPFVLRGEFGFDAPVKFSPAANYAIPTGLSVKVRPGGFLLNARLPGRKLPFVCYAGRQIEEIDLTFAEGLPLPKTLNSRKIENHVFTYTADSRIEDRTLKIRREFVSHVPSQVCGPEVEALIAGPMQDVTANVQARMSFEPPAPPPVSENKNPERQANALPAARNNEGATARTVN
jgi:transglutaminase-like putative cysteine protease